MACGVALGDRVPTEVFDRDPCLVAGVLEADVQLGALIGGEALLTPGYDQAVRRVPDAHLANDEHRAVFVGLDQAAVRARLERRERRSARA